MYLIVFCFFNMNHKGKVNLEKLSNNHTYSLQILSFEWKKDSLGCYNIRSIDLFDSLLDGFYLNTKSVNDFLKIFFSCLYFL